MGRPATCLQLLAQQVFNKLAKFFLRQAPYIEPSGVKGDYNDV